MYSQIQNTENCNAVISSREEDEINASTDLIDNGPKNEIYLYSGMSLTLNLNSNREVQIGLRGLQNKMTCRIGDTNQEVSTTDMFYIIKENGNIGTVTITNPSDSNTILAVSKLKVSDSIDSLETISEENILDMLHTMGYKEPVPMAEAFANINLVDYTGAVIASTSLTANGEQGTDAAFTADTLKYAAESVLPEGYAIVDAASIVDRTVKYGESADVNVQIGKVATLQVTYKKLFGKTVGTATLIGVQISAEESYSFSASEIKKAVPDGYWTVKLFGTKVEYGTTSKLTVNVF